MMSGLWAPGAPLTACGTMEADSKTAVGTASQRQAKEQHMTFDDPRVDAINEADRYVRRAMANVAKLRENTLRRAIEENLMVALDILQAELEETPDD